MRSSGSYDKMKMTWMPRKQMQYKKNDDNTTNERQIEIQEGNWKT
jgi:hypothetical protein